MHGFDLILTLAGGLTAALALGYVTQRLGLSPIVGYLLAGTLVGPHTPGFVADTGLAEQLAEIGVVLLMFGVGLQFRIEELLAVRRIAVPGAIAQSAVAALLGAGIARAFGWEWPAAVVFGIALAVASTVVLIRVLSDNHDLHTPTGHIAVGWLVVEDLLTVIVLVLLPAFFGAGAASSSLGLTLSLTALKVAGLVVFAIAVGKRGIPWLLDLVAGTRSRELFTLAVLVLALGIAVGSAAVFGVSMALGAFLAGMIVGRSDYSLRAASEALPMRDAFAVLFFVSVGMLLDPRSIAETPMLIGATLMVVVIGKPLVAIIVVLLLRYPFGVALAVAVALAQIGEFSFILAALGKELGVLSNAAMNTIVAVSIVSIVMNPLLYRVVLPAERWVSSRPNLRRWLRATSGRDVVSPDAPGNKAFKHADEPAYRAVIVGYGPTGRTVARLLRDSGIRPTVIDLNINTVRQLREDGVTAVYGEASHRETLQEAGVANAGSLILSAAGMDKGEEIIRIARELNPAIHVLARTTHLRDRAALQKSGANRVYSGEGEVAIAFIEDILHRLGATPDQIDRERERVHEDLFGHASHLAMTDKDDIPVSA